ncbi:MAG: AAA family ATPase [Clostridia bacterium]
MNLESLTFKNIGPYGNKLITIDLLPEGGLWLITGKNGGGKSTLLNLPKALFYGKVDKLKKDQIANRFNKYGIISGTIRLSPTDTCIIERGFSPSSLIVYKNGEDIGKAGLNDYQQFIDNEVTKLPYNIFSNVVSLSVNDFKSFISMTPNDKRHIIDKIFSMEIINKMYEYVKKDIRDIKYNIDILNKEIHILTKNTDKAKIELLNINKKTQENSEDKLKFIITKLREIKPNLDKAKIKLQEYTQKKNSVLEAINILSKNKTQKTTELTILKQKIELYNKDKCPTCETVFTDDKYTFIKEELTEKYKELKNSYDELINVETTYNNTLSTLNDGINKLSSYINANNNSIQQLKYQYDQINKSDDNLNSEAIQNIINANNDRVSDIENQKTTVNIDFKYLNILEMLYSGDGIKRKIMESYLPHLNKEVELTLNELNFPYTLQFDNNFEPIIKHLGLDISADSLSTGERKRADLSVLISIIRMMKRKFPNLNMFLLDEVLSSVDSDGVIDIISYLQKTSKDMHINIFVINHTVLPIEFFDKKINITKNDNFSEISTENIS